MGRGGRNPKVPTPAGVHDRVHQPPKVAWKTDFGVWTTYTWDNKGRAQRGAILEPDHAPWRDVFAYLDNAGSRLSSRPVSHVEEAMAMVAACWQFGSYLFLLSYGEAYPPFREDPALSRLSDAEMRRINIEFSAGIAAWLEARLHDPRSVARRVRAALQELPIGWADMAEEIAVSPEVARRLHEQLLQFAAIAQHGAEQRGRLGMTLPRQRDQAPDATQANIVRTIANRLVRMHYRNDSPLEDLHAGTWSGGSEVPGYRRFSPTEVNGIARSVARRMAVELAACDLGEGQMHLGRALLLQGEEWTLTEETGLVYLPGMPGATETPDARLSWLAQRMPTLYTPSAGDRGRIVARDLIDWTR